LVTSRLLDANEIDFADVAQLDRAPDYGLGGSGFESWHPHHKNTKGYSHYAVALFAYLRNKAATVDTENGDENTEDYWAVIRKLPADGVALSPWVGSAGSESGFGIDDDGTYATHSVGPLPVLHDGVSTV
jgi:hypothetical protein